MRVHRATWPAPAPAGLHRDGRMVRFPRGSLPDPAADPADIAVTGGGPDLPEVGEVRRGGLRGRIIRDGEALGGITVQVCVGPRRMFEQTPCTGQPLQARTVTDDRGGFRFENVPVGTCGFAVRVDSEWIITCSTEVKGMKPGRIYEVGSLDAAR